jgi:flagellar hook-basal body complex protein FliE
MIGAIPLVDSVLGPSAADSLQSAGKSAVTIASNSIGDFGQMLTQVTSDAVNNLKTGEATAISGLQGKATIQQVVEAVSGAQTSLQTVLAIRDKAVSAYQDITRMSI